MRREWAVIAIAFALYNVNEETGKGKAEWQLGVGHAHPIRCPLDLTALVLHLAAAQQTKSQGKDEQRHCDAGQQRTRYSTAERSCKDGHARLLFREALPGASTAVTHCQKV